MEQGPEQTEASPQGESSGERDGPPSRLLFPVDGEHTEDLLRLVCALVDGWPADLVLAAPVTVPNQTPLDAPQLSIEGKREVGRYALKVDQTCEGTEVSHTAVEVGHRRSSVIQNLVNRFGITTVFIEGGLGNGLGDRLGIDGVDGPAIKGVCDTIFVSRFASVFPLESVLVPVARGPHSGLAIQVGLAIAKRRGIPLELLHVYEPTSEQARLAGEEVLELSQAHVSDYEAVETTLVGSDRRKEKIIEYSKGYDLTVFGAPREGLLRQYLAGSIPEDSSELANGIVLTTHKGGAETSWLDRWI